MAAPQAPYIGRSGKEKLDQAIFSEPFHMALVHETVRAELNARRRGTHSTKTRAEVAMTGAKAFRQKGTGRARAGALSTPQRYGGGVAFGPKPRHYTLKVNRKARRRALRAALSVHAGRDSLAIVDPAAFDPPSAKQAAEGVAGHRGNSTLVVLAGAGEDACAKSFRNLDGVSVKACEDVGVADIVRARWLVLSPAALEYLSRVAAAPATHGVGRSNGGGSE